MRSPEAVSSSAGWQLTWTVEDANINISVW